MPDDVQVPDSSTGTETQTPAELAKVETPGVPKAPLSPVKVAIEKGDIPEMNRLMDIKLRERRGLPPLEKPKEERQPLPGDPATPSAAELAESGAESVTDDNQEPKETPKPEKETGKERNFRKLEANRDEWKRKFEDLEQKYAGQPAASPKPAAQPQPTTFTEPEPDWEEYLARDGVEDIAGAKKLWKPDHDAWMGRRDAANHVQSRTRIAQESAVDTKIKRRDAIYAKLETLSKEEGFENAREYFDQSGAPFTDDMLQFYAEDEHGGKVLYHMVLNPDKAETLVHLPPALRKERLTAIRDSLVTPNKPAPTIKNTTDAPRPMRTQVTGQTGSTAEPLKRAIAKYEKSGDPEHAKEINRLMNERKLARMGR